jgi:hypothetical protein
MGESGPFHDWSSATACIIAMERLLQELHNRPECLQGRLAAALAVLLQTVASIREHSTIRSREPVRWPQACVQALVVRSAVQDAGFFDALVIRRYRKNPGVLPGTAILAEQCRIGAIGICGVRC